MSYVDMQMATLYVGDLHPEVSEPLLIGVFSTVAPLHSVRLCRPRRPDTFFSYAFVNFHHESYAELALVLLNYEILLGQPMRIMWSNRNPSLRNSNMGNIFIKGLEKSIDSRSLHETFSTFGHVLSCKVVCDDYGSRGYGYVQFENVEAAEAAIAKLNGTLFNDLNVFITHFKSHQERHAANRIQNGTTAIEDNSRQVHVSQVQGEDERHPKIQNGTTAIEDNSRQVHVSQVQREDEGHPKIQNATTAIEDNSRQVHVSQVQREDEGHPKIQNGMTAIEDNSRQVRVSQVQREDEGHPKIQNGTTAIEDNSRQVRVSQVQREDEGHPKIQNGTTAIEDNSRQVRVSQVQREDEEHPNIQNRTTAIEDNSRQVRVSQVQREDEGHPKIQNGTTAIEDNSRQVRVSQVQREDEGHPKIQNGTTAIEDNSRQVRVSQVQREDEGHPNIQNRTTAIVQNPTVGKKPKTTVMDAVPALVLPAKRAIYPLNPGPALYVGNLHLDVTESLLVEKFSSVGPVHAVQLCRARRPGASNNYAFVNFQHQKDAERALDLLKDDILLGQPMRIMWSNRIPSLSNSNMGNIFIKGLEKSIDSLALYDIFSVFGYILSCKVVTNEHWSRGYGYVQFENAEAAKTAIKMLNGTLFKDHKMLITHLKSHQECQSTNKITAKGDSKEVHVSRAQKAEKRHPKIQNRVEEVHRPTRKPLINLVPAAVNPVPDSPKPVPTLYIGDLHPDVTESLLLQKFRSAGQVISVRLCRAKTPGTFNNYAFIYFQHETDAKRALRMLNFGNLLGQPMPIMWSKRNTSLRNRNLGNIFIKGLEKSIDSFALYDIFRNFGNILSCKVVCNENGSRGYGYVHFENAEAAETAIEKLNGTLFNDFKVFITHFKSRHERKAEKDDKKNQSLPQPKNKKKRKKKNVQTN